MDAEDLSDALTGGFAPRTDRLGMRLSGADRLGAVLADLVPNAARAPSREGDDRSDQYADDEPGIVLSCTVYQHRPIMALTLRYNGLRSCPVQRLCCIG
jgi:hypothetical protein